MPSLWKETFGYTGLEAFAHGVPLLLSANVGIQDLVRDGETAIVFEPTIQGLTEALTMVIQDRGILRKIEANLRHLEVDLSMASHTHDVLKLYAHVRAEADRGPRHESGLE